jgi:hypothetical protein
LRFDLSEKLEMLPREYGLLTDQRAFISVVNSCLRENDIFFRF